MRIGVYGIGNVLAHDDAVGPSVVRLVASGVSRGVAELSDSSPCDFFFFDFAVGSGVSPGVAEPSDSSAPDFFGFFFFGDDDGEAGFFFFPGDPFDFGDGAGVLWLAGDSTACAFRTGVSSSVCSA